MSQQSLTIIDHIRMRPAMYVGDLTIRGLKTMIGYLFDDILKNNSNKTEIVIEFKKDNRISLKVDEIETSLFVETINYLQSENKYITLGLPVIIALSEQAEIKVQKPPSLIWLQAKNGIYKYATTTGTSQTNGIELNFKIDGTIFKDLTFNYEVINQFIRRYAFINNHCRIISIDSQTNINQVNLFDYPKGISHQLDYKIGEQLYGKPFFRLDLNTKIGKYTYQVCISYQNIWLGQNYIMTYANYDELINGGSLEKGILKGISLAFRQFAEKRRVEIETRKIKEQLTLVAVVKGDEFNFHGATKTKLNMPHIKKDIKQFIAEQIISYLLENDHVGQEILNKLVKTN